MWMVWGRLGVRWVDFGLLCVPLLPLHCISVPQVNVLSYFRLSWRRCFGRIDTSSPCCCPLVACRCALLSLCLTPHSVCCQCVRFGAAIYLNFFARALSFVCALLIMCPAAFRQEVHRSAAALFSNHALSILGTFLTLSRVWQVLCAFASATSAFLFPVNTMFPMCVVTTVILFLCAPPFSHLLFTRLPPPSV